MTREARQIFETLARRAAGTVPHFRNQKDPATMDDITLGVVVGLALLALWFSGESDGTILTVDVSDQGAPELAPIAVPPTPTSIAVTVEPPPTQPPSQGGDELDLSQAVIVGGSPDVRGWPIATQLAITQLEPAIVPTFSDPGWPDIIPPGFEGPIQFTVWAFAFLGGQWIGSGFIEMWRDRGNCGNNDAGNVRAQLQQNWWYYVPELAGYQPAPGDKIGFMVTSGDSRMGRGPFSVQQRSNVVMVTMP